MSGVVWMVSRRQEKTGSEEGEGAKTKAQSAQRRKGWEHEDAKDRRERTA